MRTKGSGEREMTIKSVQAEGGKRCRPRNTLDRQNRRNEQKKRYSIYIYSSKTIINNLTFVQVIQRSFSQLQLNFFRIHTHKNLNIISRHQQTTSTIILFAPSPFGVSVARYQPLTPILFEMRSNDIKYNFTRKVAHFQVTQYFKHLPEARYVDDNSSKHHSNTQLFIIIYLLYCISVVQDREISPQCPLDSPHLQTQQTINCYIAMHLVQKQPLFAFMLIL